jgi:hypothetical protein
MNTLLFICHAFLFKAVANRGKNRDSGKSVTESVTVLHGSATVLDRELFNNVDWIRRCHGCHGFLTYNPPVGFYSCYSKAGK